VELVVGWSEEPAFVGFKNAVSLRVSRGGEPVEGLAQTLKVEVSLGDERKGPLDLSPVFGEEGEYEAPLVPTAPGAYDFRFTGTIGDQAIDETFRSSDGQFDEVQGTSEVSFPLQAPPNAELAQAIDRVDAAARSVDDAAATARTMAMVAIALGAIALVLGIGAFVRKR
jgi:hypothetical protein